MADPISTARRSAPIQPAAALPPSKASSTAGQTQGGSAGQPAGARTTVAKAAGGTPGSAKTAGPVQVIHRFDGAPFQKKDGLLGTGWGAQRDRTHQLVQHQDANGKWQVNVQAVNEGRVEPSQYVFSSNRPVTVKDFNDTHSVLSQKAREATAQLNADGNRLPDTPAPPTAAIEPSAPDKKMSAGDWLVQKGKDALGGASASVTSTVGMVGSLPEKVGRLAGNIGDGGRMGINAASGGRMARSAFNPIEGDKHLHSRAGLTNVEKGLGSVQSGINKTIGANASSLTYKAGELVAPVLITHKAGGRTAGGASSASAKGAARSESVMAEMGKSVKHYDGLGPNASPAARDAAAKRVVEAQQNINGLRDKLRADGKWSAKDKQDYLKVMKEHGPRADQIGSNHQRGQAGSASRPSTRTADSAASPATAEEPHPGPTPTPTPAKATGASSTGSATASQPVPQLPASTASEASPQPSARSQVRFGRPVNLSGRLLTAELARALVAAPPDAKVNVTTLADGTHRLVSVHPEWGETSVVELKSVDAKWHLEIEAFELPLSERGKGVGLQLFNRQAAAARSLGVDTIEVKTVDSAAVRSYSNGYDFWARAGFDLTQPLQWSASQSASLHGALKQPADAALPQSLPELMRTPAGRTWWRENGTGAAMVFDNRDGSASRATLGETLQRHAQTSSRP